jgi:CheY-like chemotaxis protein
VVRRIAVTKLSRLGYEVTDVDNGHVPNLLITDSLMPRMNGLQLVRALRQSSNFDLSALPSSY